MTLEEIKQAVKAGRRVCYKQDYQRVKRTLVKCNNTELWTIDNIFKGGTVPLMGEPNEFYVLEDSAMSVKLCNIILKRKQQSPLKEDEIPSMPIITDEKQVGLLYAWCNALVLVRFGKFLKATR